MGNLETECTQACNSPNHCKQICRSVSDKQKQQNLKPITFENDNCIYPMETGQRLHRVSPEIQIPNPQTRLKPKEKEKIVSTTSINNNVEKQVVLIGSAKAGLQSMISIRSENYKIQTMEIPFDVIKLTINPEIISEINKRNPQFMRKHSESQELAKNWRLTTNGSYTNFISRVYGAILTRRTFYQGYFLYDSSLENQEESHIPDGKGLFINRHITYEGELNAGKANGRGKLHLRNQMHNFEETYEGVWQGGKLTKGKIKTMYYEYQGELRNGHPHGQGELELKGIKYIGRFQYGLFDDEVGVYECSQYNYKGGFKDGKKNGYGMIYLKKRDIRYQGQWLDDTIQVYEENE